MWWPDYAVHVKFSSWKVGVGCCRSTDGSWSWLDFYFEVGLMMVGTAAASVGHIADDEFVVEGVSPTGRAELLRSDGTGCWMEKRTATAGQGRRICWSAGLLAGAARASLAGCCSPACCRRCPCSHRCSSSSFVDEEGRSWIYNRDVVTVLSNGSDHPIGASPVVGCVGSRRGRW
ncbi:hypothetical protein ACLOJK_019434 [Asimina triloba]